MFFFIKVIRGPMICNSQIYLRRRLRRRKRLDLDGTRTRIARLQHDITDLQGKCTMSVQARTHRTVSDRVKSKKNELENVKNTSDTSTSFIRGFRSYLRAPVYNLRNETDQILVVSSHSSHRTS
ncbi:hypothetical protein K435DRAFT_503140 [Dendrothele bispora CBS 962.96]|uniref:Uncharacterized protein n=1 Tax=Dendrothele bispora (strain CBS 962.96) TaxID=1314807 RepID=A0A4S8KWY1_DENBC|nr:hypothetical protein K435DRAFT_503100 [Dendrothele bispora CBS 962.96]THU80345.1 hypothetical protein K435DRAFT_503140 [Dendrothele bispora CBS 962.96]